MAQRFEGKNLEEALDNAATTFGVQRFQLTYHVLLEKRGFLGGMKRVVIEAEVNTEAPQQTEQPAARPQQQQRQERPRGERSARGGGGGGGRGRGRNRDRGDRGGERRGDEQRRDRPRRSPERRDEEEYVPVEIPPQGAESPNAEIVRAWFERVIALAQLSLELRTEENDTQVIVRFYGRDARRLTEGHGELIDALQVLGNKAMVGRKTEKEIEVDCQQFKGKRVEEIEQQAREVADRVRRDHREQLLPAMTPIERRIVHLALQDDQEVATVSRGDGFYKRVAIVPRSSQEPQEQSTAGS